MKINSKDLKHNILNNKIENIYLFSGPEIGEKNEIIKLIEKKIFPDQDPVKFFFYCGNEFDNIQFMNTLNTGLLFSDKKIVFLKNIEQISSTTIKSLEDYIIPSKFNIDIFEKNILNKIKNQERRKQFQNYYIKEKNFYKLKEKLNSTNKKNILEILYSINFKNFNSDTYLIMLNETNEKIPGALVTLLLEHQNIMFWEMFENQKIEWVREEFKKRGLYIKEEAIYFILDMIENNKSQLLFEIEKISYLVKMNEEKVINLSNIEEYLFHSKVESPFSLYSAILKKDLSKSIDILDNLFLTNEMSLLNGIIWAHRRFLNALDLYENHNIPIMDIFNKLKIFSARDKNDFKIGFSNYNFNHACLMFYSLSELDYYLKILPANLQLVKLQEFIINFINGDIQKSFLQGRLQFLHS